MKQEIIQKLRRVKFKDLGHIVLFLAALPVAGIYRRKRADLWLVCDSRMEARDNGYWLFRYVRKHYPTQDIVYAIDRNSPDWKRVSPHGEVIPYGTFRHWVYYLTASKNISSQKEGKPNAAVCYLLEVYGVLKNTRVFLQHGIIMNDLEFLYYKNTKMRLFLCSTRQETEYVRQSFGYPDGWVQQTGLCRFDQLYDMSSGKRQILFMPTWRSWIGNPDANTQNIEKGCSFEQTTFFRYWNALLHSERLEQLLEQQDLELVFYPHRRMQPFLAAFQLNHPHIRIANWPDYDVQKLLKESNLLVTDYSSISVDFAYMKKPLLYYQFDYEQFRKGQYEEGYFSYENDGFGKVCHTDGELIWELEQIAHTGMQMDELYQKRVDQFFDLRDQNNCQRTYEAIRKLDEP